MQRILRTLRRPSGTNAKRSLALISIKQEESCLREQVQFRFLSRAADNLGDYQRILWLQSEIRDLNKLSQRSGADVGQESSVVEARIPRSCMKALLLKQIVC